MVRSQRKLSCQPILLHRRLAHHQQSSTEEVWANQAAYPPTPSGPSQLDLKVVLKKKKAGPKSLVKRIAGLGLDTLWALTLIPGPAKPSNMVFVADSSAAGLLQSATRPVSPPFGDHPPPAPAGTTRAPLPTPSVQSMANQPVVALAHAPPSAVCTHLPALPARHCTGQPTDPPSIRSCCPRGVT